MASPPPRAFSAARAWAGLEAFAAVGPSPPGTEAHEHVVSWIRSSLAALGLEVVQDRWRVPCARSRCPCGEPPGQATLTNLLVRIPGRGRDAARRPTLVGTHFDTRWIADRDPDPARRDAPIPGVNDGGSGTAVQLELARVLLDHPPKRDVLLAFFDGEDLGDLDGHAFATGSRRAAGAGGPWEPAAVIALDMVGGRDARFNAELNSLLSSAGSRLLLQGLFRAGQRLGHPHFTGGTARVVYSDQGPYLERGLPAALLIDIDYPPWHTHGDTIEACAPETLQAVGEVLEVVLRGSGT